MKTKWFIGMLCIASVLVYGCPGRQANRPTGEQVDGYTSGQMSTCSPVHPSTDSAVHPSTGSLVNICDIDNTIFVDLKYATTDNFTGTVLYDSLDVAYLQPDVALMLAEANRRLKTLNPGLRLLVYDAARPLSVQRVMWEHVKDTKYRRYVADPDRLSLHNFGAAVDLTIADSLGKPLDMGTPFDHFGHAAGTANEQELVEQRLLTEQHIHNRQLLRQVMLHAGFHSISGEWWHFNACSLQEAKQRYKLVDR